MPFESALHLTTFSQDDVTDLLGFKGWLILLTPEPISDLTLELQISVYDHVLGKSLLIRTSHSIGELVKISLSVNLL